MKIYAYTAMTGYFDRPTGVGKHMDQMFHGLAKTPGCELSVLTARSELGADGSLRAGHPLSDLRRTILPYSRRAMEWQWNLLGRPCVDPYCSDADWIYLGYEQAIRTKRAKLAATIHSLYWFDRDLPQWGSASFRMARLKYTSIFKYLARRADLIPTVSEFLKKQIIEWLDADPGKVVVVGNGVEEEYYQSGAGPRGLSGEPADQPYVLCVGGLNTMDGGDYLIPVAQALAQLAPEIRILIAGRDNQQPYVQQAQSLNNIVSLGYVDRLQLAPLMRDSVALLFLNRYETFGIAALEAMAARTPVIGTHFTAVPEIIGHAGIMANVNKPAEIAEQIMALARSESLRAQYIASGQARADQFKWSACLNRLQQALQVR